MWVVYILKCVDNTLYTGITNKLTERILAHNTGKGAKYTKGRAPVVLMAYKEFSGRSEASKEEYRVKKLSKTKKYELIKLWSKSE